MKKILLILALLLPRAVAAQVIPPQQVVNAVSSGITVCTSGNCATWQLPNTAPSFTAQITGTMTSMTLTAEGTTDGLTWFSVFVTKLSTGVLSTTTTATGQYAVLNTGLVGFRMRCTTYASGAINVSLTRGSASNALRLIDLSNVSGTLAVANGGTGATTLTNHGVLLGQGTNAVVATAAGGSGLPLVGAGAASDPAFGVLGVVGGGTGAATSAAYTFFGNFTSASAAPGFSATPIFQAGTGTGAGVSPLQIHYKYEAVANAANTDYVTTTVFSLPQNTLTTNGDQLHIQLILSFGATGAHSKTYKCNIGYSAFATNTGAFTGGNTVMSHATSATSSVVQADMYITRTASNAGFFWEMANVGGAFQTTTWTSLSTPDFTAANNILCAANDASSGSAQVTLQEIRLIYTPAGPF